MSDLYAGQEIDNLIVVPKHDMIRVVAGFYLLTQGTGMEAAFVKATVAVEAALTMWRRNGGPLTDEDAALLEAFR